MRTDTTTNRANRALRMFSGEIAGMGTRKLDECFEMGDGDRVAAMILDKLRSDPATARAVLDGQREVRDENQRFTAHARRYLSPAMIGAAESALADPALAEAPHPGWIVVDTARDFALAHYRDHADADAHCDRAEARTGISCATERRYRTVTAIGEDAARYLQQIRMHGLPSQVEADKPSPPWQTLGQPGGRRVGANGERFDFAVRWDMETTAPGMSGYRSAWRRFTTAEEAIAAVAAGMARAYRATAFDATSREIATRHNPVHRRNRRATSATDTRARQHITLRLTSPKQADAGQLIARQDNTDALPLFGIAGQGQLL